MFLIFIALIVLMTLFFKEIFDTKEDFNTESIHQLKYKDYELVNNAYNDYGNIFNLKI